MGGAALIRAARAEDLDVFVEVGRKFHETSPLRDSVVFDPDGFATFFLQSLDNPMIAMWAAEEDGAIRGCAGAMAYPLYFAPTNTVVQELFWWTDKEYRGKNIGAFLYSAIESWSREKGASHLFMIALENERSESMAKLYARSGFAPMERTFMKGL